MHTGAVVRFVTGNLTVAEGDREEICVQLIQNTLEEDIQVSILPLDPNAQGLFLTIQITLKL